MSTTASDPRDQHDPLPAGGAAPDWLAFERRHVWHPYAAMPAAVAPLPVREARGCHIVLEDGTVLVDGMASWWAAIHGYNHPRLNEAAIAQLGAMSHVMFGGLTHRPAAALAERLLALAPDGLDHVFFTDSGSVAVEVALKMALQYQAARGRPERHRFLSFRHGYHGDTAGAMSVSDPDNGMHHLFAGHLPRQLHAPAPVTAPGAVFDGAELDAVRDLLDRHADGIAAVIIEPLVQGAGGMRFYHPGYLAALAALCRDHETPLIVDEIATGFGRTGTLFACEQAGIVPDILCVGKALTGGYLTLGATLAGAHIADTIGGHGDGAFMHGPTFMANPLACAVALASIELLLDSDWQDRVRAIECQLRDNLAPCRQAPAVRDVRVFGAIGVVEMERPLDMAETTRRLVAAGVWLRPFGRLLYTMPPYVIDSAALARITGAMRSLCGL